MLEMSSGAGTNLEVGGTGPAWSTWKKIFRGRAPPLFGPKITIRRFGERFPDGQYSLVTFLFAILLTAPRAQPFVKVGHVLPCPMESAPLEMSRSETEISDSLASPPFQSVTSYSIGVPRILQWSRGKAPVGSLRTLEQKVKLVYNFNVFLYKILDLMNIRAGQTHNTKVYLKIQWRFERP